MTARGVGMLVWALALGVSGVASRRSSDACVCTAQTVLLGKLEAALSQLENLEKSASAGAHLEKSSTQCNKGCTRSCDGSCDHKSKGHPSSSCDSSCDSGCNGCSADKHKPDQHKDDKPPPEKKPSQTAEDKLKAELEHEKHANEALQHHIKEDEEKLKGLAKADGEKLKGLALSRDAVQQQLDASHAAYDALAQELEAKRQTATELQAQIKSLRDQVKYADKCPCAVDIVADADAALARYSDSHSHATRSALALGVAGAGMLGMAVLLRAREQRRRLAREML